MKTIELKLFDYGELSEEAKKKAHSAWNERNFDTYDLQVHLDNHIEGLLEKHKIKTVSDVKGYSTKYPKIYFSLAHCQGDGVMFEGNFEWKKYTIYIKHSGRYYHSHSALMEIQETKNLGFHMDDEHKDVKEFERIYHEICKELEKVGYEHIDDMESEEYFIETCNANEYTFEADGTMRNI